jgi:hypothetical protein
VSSVDKRCCGSGVCIINAQGECWCGQVWNGEKMVHPPLKMNEPSNSSSHPISKFDTNNKNS